MTNRIQGQSLQHALINLKSTCGTQALYVMILHVVSLNNLAVTHWFLSTNVNRHLSKAYRNEFNNFKNLDKETRLVIFARGNGSLGKCVHHIYLNWEIMERGQVFPEGLNMKVMSRLVNQH